jgi:nucleoid-associated protein EbfC
MKGGIGDLLRKAQQMQDSMQKAQAELATLEVTGEAGGGLVKVVLNGQHEAKRVTIDPRLMTEAKDMLEDLLVAACNDAVRKIAANAQERYSDLASGLNLPSGMKLPF